MAETHPGGGVLRGGWVCGVEATLKTLTPSVKEYVYNSQGYQSD